MARQVALLRGINVGKHRPLPMAELRSLMEELGFEDVATHLRSGNVVYSTTATPAAAAARIEAGIEERFGFAVSVLARTAKQIAAVLACDPLREHVTNDSRYHVTFLPGPVPAGAGRELLTADLGPDALAIEGHEIYFWCPNGTVDSRAVDALARSKVAVDGTDRNWNTVAKIATMLEEG